MVGTRVILRRGRLRMLRFRSSLPSRVYSLWNGVEYVLCDVMLYDTIGKEQTWRFY
jgi:hypothetical protein